MTSKTFSSQALALSVLVTLVAAGVCNWMVFGRSAEVDRALMGAQIRENSEDIGDLTRLLREQAASQATFLSQVAILTTRLDAFLDRQGG